QVYTSSDFDFTGGMIGFMAAWRYYELGVDNLKVWSDRDGDGAYETLEHQDFFTLDASGYAPQGPQYDAAGNLTYDGVFAYGYDAWNRLIQVSKAWRSSSDDGSGGVTLGPVQTGSVVQALRYDG